ncbi:MAG TPA: nuclear transport factor 2 family protein [Vicinamibacterales bacterium]|nr:nuclear transport factor 2 family protein [Vicinamibacterales bacterium]
MKAAVLAAAAMLLSTSAAFAQNAMTTKLMAAENKMLDDLTAGKKDAFFAVIAPGSWSVDEGGWMKIDDFKQSWDQIKIQSSKTSDMKVVPINATAAIVTYKLEQKGSMGGQPFPSPVYASTVWVQKNGKWWAVFHQESTPAKK